MSFPNLMSPDMIFRIPALLLALTIHEFAHAFVSHRLGDPTPKRQGRLTLNPLAHIDPIGLIMLWLFRFGWGRPVEIDPSYYRDRRKGTILVSFAGPLSNMITAFVIAWLQVLAFYTLRNSFLSQLLATAFSFNIFLAVFNLIPIPPLDGSKILAGLLPGRLSYKYQVTFGQWGMFLLLVFIATPLSSIILLPLANALSSTIWFIVTNVVGLFI
ncbi:MAG: Peptidase M50 [Bacillota bacterium]|nr:MAG: Peptidase M50 [Bacillota bacterium]MBS3950368.1 site-2 protease family protein [Peptococcaceae bacterium]